MSEWVHIAMAHQFRAYSEKDNLKEYVENVLKDAPKITGSERNANVFVNVLDEDNNDTVVITVSGSLRDKTEKKTWEELKEFEKFLNSKGLYNITVQQQEDD